MPAIIDAIDLKKYESDGFLLIEDLVSESELAGLQERLREYTHGGKTHQEVVFQVEPRVTRGELKVDHPGDGIRKIDRLVENDDRYQHLGKHPNIVAVLNGVRSSYLNVKLVI